LRARRPVLAEGAWRPFPQDPTACNMRTRPARCFPLQKVHAGRGGGAARAIRAHHE